MFSDTTETIWRRIPLDLIANRLHLIAFPDLSGDNGGVAPFRGKSLAAWRDRLGICLSMLCLIHCLLTPVIVGLLPVGTLLGFWQHGFHEVFLIIVPVVALVAFIPGWRTHRDARVWGWGAAGVGLLILGVLIAERLGHGSQLVGPAFWSELFFTSLGGLCLIRAHWLNRELCVCCERDHKPVHEPKKAHASCGHDHGPHGHPHAH